MIDTDTEQWLDQTARIAMIDGQQVAYDRCTDVSWKNAIKQYPEADFEYLGWGKIFSLNGELVDKSSNDSAVSYYFFKMRSEYKLKHKLNMVGE